MILCISIGKWLLNSILTPRFPWGRCRHDLPRRSEMRIASGFLRSSSNHRLAWSVGAPRTAVLLTFQKVWRRGYYATDHRRQDRLPGLRTIHEISRWSNETCSFSGLAKMPLASAFLVGSGWNNLSPSQSIRSHHVLWFLFTSSGCELWKLKQFLKVFLYSIY